MLGVYGSLSFGSELLSHEKHHFRLGHEHLGFLDSQLHSSFGKRCVLGAEAECSLLAVCQFPDCVQVGQRVLLNSGKDDVAVVVTSDARADELVQKHLLPIAVACGFAFIRLLQRANLRRAEGRRQGFYCEWPADAMPLLVFFGLVVEGGEGLGFVIGESLGRHIGDGFVVETL